MDDDVPLSFRMGKKDNDREINEWYNEVKIGRQIGICRGVCYYEKNKVYNFRNLIFSCDVIMCNNNNENFRYTI